MLVYIGFDQVPLLFRCPEEIIVCREPSAIRQSFEQMEYLLDKGYYLAGFLSYEAGAYFESRLSDPIEPSFPLTCMGSYKSPMRDKRFLADNSACFHISGLRTSISFSEYSKNIKRIHDYIAQGDVCQITYCIKEHFGFTGNSRSMFAKLLKWQPVPYPAYIEIDDYAILSLSPEMFIKKEGEKIRTKPMKGTWPRGRNSISDIMARYRFKYDEKNRAENVMITDLLRNDLGRIGRKVRVPSLFEVTGYRTLFQMTSGIAANVDKKIPLYELFKALFPSGSVTGAPKIRAMEIIREIEKEERKIYTGAIGYITPERDMYFNVPIRTMLLQNGKGEIGIGGGIIWDSTPEGEWAEGILKAKFLSEC